MATDMRWQPYYAEVQEPIPIVTASELPPGVVVFPTGAIRSTPDGKADWTKALSIQALERYVAYMQAHQSLPDGGTRDLDDWKKGLPLSAYIPSLVRHVVQVWREYDRTGVPSEDALCAVLFNAMGALHESLKTTWAAPPSP